MHRCGSLLISRSNDLREIAKVGAGKYDRAEEDVDVGALIQGCIRQVATAARAAGQTLTAEVQPELPILRGDQRVLVQVLNNLLSNAIKFTPQGGRIAVRAWADAAGSILLSVTANGIGMTEEGDRKSKSLNSSH